MVKPSSRPAVIRPQWLFTYMLILLFFGSFPGLAQGPAENLAMEIAPNPTPSTEPVLVTVTGSAFCPRLHEPEIFNGVVEIGFESQCAILPPDPGPFSLFTAIPPLTPGIWEIHLLNRDPPMPVVAAVVLLRVTDPAFSVQLMPSPAGEDDEVIAVIEGFGQDPFLPGPPVIEPGRIEVRVAECGICDPPSPPAEFQLEQSIGQLEAGEYLVELFYLDQRVAESTLEVVEDPPSCLPNATSLCLNDDRFRVEAEWTTPDGQSGRGLAVQETADSGFFWFFSRDNIELVLKVLDACDTEFNSFWVFAAGLTDVGVVIEVTDTVTDTTARYSNPVGQRFVTITDTGAFNTCP